MVYHLKHAMSLRDIIATQTATSLTITRAIENAGLHKGVISEYDITDHLELCGKAVTPEGVERCMFFSSEELIAEIPGSRNKSEVFDKFLRSLDKEIEETNKELYEERLL